MQQIENYIALLLLFGDNIRVFVLCAWIIVNYYNNNPIH